MRVLIYGAGAVGLGIASCLLKSKCQVDIVARENTVSALRKHGLVRTGIWGSFHAEPSKFGSYTSLGQVRARKYDYILVCTKSFDSLAAAKDLSEHKSLFGKETKTVLFQNGWGNAEIFLSFFGRERVYNARVITGFHRPNANEVAITVHADSIHIGSLFNKDSSLLTDLCEAIAEGDIPCQTTNEIEKDLWAKMLYNCALNPLGAILDVPYGVLAENETTRTIMNGIVDEAFSVMTKAGYKTHWPTSKDFLEVFYDKLVPDTAEHKSSTLQDIMAKKRTEIDALNGAVIRLAERYKVEVPYNLVIYNLIRFIEGRSM
jgi:2-dehydropantoate 2-reductase